MEPPLLSADSVALQGGAAPAAGKGHPACGVFVGWLEIFSLAEVDLNKYGS